MTHVIFYNNTTLHYMVRGNKYDEKNFFHGQVIKSLLYNFLNKLRSEFGQKDDLTENQGRIHEYKGIIIYYLITRNIPLEDTKTLYHHVAMLLFANKWTSLDIHLCVLFLCTKVKSPTLQDATKIWRIICYQDKTVHLPFCIRNRWQWNPNFVR